MILEKVISGGQTGADQGGLQGAYLEGLETGGCAPKGYRTELGEQCMLLLRDRYGLYEHRSALYPPRTKENVANSDGTVVFGDSSSRGSRLTIRYCNEARKPYEVVTAPSGRELANFIYAHQIRILNVAGNRASVSPDVYRIACLAVREAVQILKNQFLDEFAENPDLGGFPQ